MNEQRKQKWRLRLTNGDVLSEFELGCATCEELSGPALAGSCTECDWLASHPIAQEALS